MPGSLCMEQPLSTQLLLRRTDRPTCPAVGPVMNNPHLRNIWENAFAVLANAAKIVIIGFSFQPSDFYAAWLFRYALKYRQDAKVLVVNPGNTDTAFQERMQSIFGHRCDRRWNNFTQIDQIIRRTTQRPSIAIYWTAANSCVAFSSPYQDFGTETVMLRKRRPPVWSPWM